MALQSVSDSLAGLIAAKAISNAMCQTKGQTEMSWSRSLEADCSKGLPISIRSGAEQKSSFSYSNRIRIRSGHKVVTRAEHGEDIRIF